MTDKFDDAIDRAVREMLDVEPRADLRARVMARLPASGSRLPAHGFRLPAVRWVLAPLAAAALIVLAIFLARRSEPLPQAPVVAQRSDQHLPADRVAVPAVTQIARPAARRGSVPERRRVEAQSLESDGAGGIEPLHAIAPISVPPIVERRIAPADIAVRPLTPIAEMQIAPLTPPDRR